MVATSDESYSNLASWRQQPIKSTKTKVKAEYDFDNVLDIESIKDPNLLWVTKYHLSKLGLDKHVTITRQMISETTEMMLYNIRGTSRKRNIKKVYQASAYLMQLFHPKENQNPNLWNTAPSTFRAKHSQTRTKTVRFKEYHEVVMFPNLETVSSPEYADLSQGSQQQQQQQQQQVKVSPKKRRQQLLQVDRIRDPFVKRLAFLSLSALELRSDDDDESKHNVTIEEVDFARNALISRLQPHHHSQNSRHRRRRSQQKPNPWVASHRQSIHAAHKHLVVLIRRQEVIEHVGSLATF